MYSEFARHWTLDPNVTFLNHGSFGACPKVVLERQAELRAQLEREPVHFFFHEYEKLLDRAREHLANFVGAEPDQLAFVRNATQGVNAVLRSLDFHANDELLVTNQEYNASRNALNFVADKAQAKVVVVDIPFPIASGREIQDLILEKVTPRTRLALLDHITSQTAMIMPLASLGEELRKRDVLVLVDGAHGPGMLPLKLSQLPVDFYTGNCHKWVCSPKGSALLYVRDPNAKEQIRPTSISHGANSPRADRSRFQLEFDWTGTDDPTAIFSISAAIEFFENLLPGGWEETRNRNRQLALQARKGLCEKLAIPLPCPDELIGNMAAIPLPRSPLEIDPTPLDPDPFQAALMEQFGIQVPVMTWPAHPDRLLRISAQLYNSAQQYERLGNALQDLLISSAKR